ncbi:MAG: hypothetical protein ACTSWY_12470 [Promethearchaeota archaeon]
MSSIENMIEEIDEIVSEVFSNHAEVEGMCVASYSGKNIYSKFREDNSRTPDITAPQLAAAATSLLFIASNMFERIFSQKMSYTITKSDQWIWLNIINKTISGSCLFDRNLAELSGISELKKEMTQVFLKISAVVETSESIKEDVFVRIKRAIPNAISIAIINKEGLPIKVQSSIDGTKLSAFLYALYQLTGIILKKQTEYTIIGGGYGSIIIQKIDNERILGISVPESDDAKLGKYIAKIQEISRNLE